MNSKRAAFFVFALSLITILATGCNEGNLTDSPSEQDQLNPNGAQNAPTSLRVVLTDAPADYEAVYIDIQEVKVRRELESDEGDSAEADTTKEYDDEQWVTVSTDSQRVDLLTLRNGNTLTIGDGELEPGHYTQLRLVLGDDNAIVKNGTSYYLKTPSAQQSGLKLQIDAEIEEGNTYSLLVDFDAARSIVEAGNKRSPKGVKYLLKPVLRAVNLQASGSVSGTVEPDDFSTTVFTVIDEDTISTVTDTAGVFQIMGLDPGTYDLTFEPDSSTFRDTTLTGIEVFSGENTDLGTITLEEEGS